MPGTKGLPTEMADHVRELVAEIIARDFTDSDGKPWSERRIAKGMGMAQPVLHTVRKGSGIGVAALLALRKYTGQSIDVILGLGVPERETVNNAQLENLQQQVDALITIVQEQMSKRPGPYSKAAKALAELGRARRFVVGQRILDEKARSANEPLPAKKGVA